MSMSTINIISTLTTSPGSLTGTFENQIFELLTHSESFKPKAYVGKTNGFLNIGYGYDINKQIDYFISDFAYVANLKLSNTVIQTQYLQSDYNSVNSEPPSAIVGAFHAHYTLSPGVDGSAWQLSLLALNQLLPTTGLYGLGAPAPVVYDSNLFIIAPSYQLVALEDMAYNGNNSLVGPQTKLIHDLKEATLASSTSDWINAWTSRDEAWYEIAFNSDSGNPPGDQLGLELR